MMDLQNFMDNGLIVHKAKNNTYDVQKIETLENKEKFLDGKNTKLNFSFIDDAYKFCENYIESLQSLQECEISMAINPTGLSLKVINLGKIKAASYEEALEQGHKLADKYLFDNDLKDQIKDDYEIQAIVAN